MEVQSEAISWEDAIGELLRQLSDVQQEVLDVLSEKREFLVNADTQGMASLQEREQSLVNKLQHCQHIREKLLQRARGEGLPSDNVRTLCEIVPRGSRGELGKRIKESSHRARLLQHNSITNWLLVQRTMLHLAQMLEILATGGELQPTYGKEVQVAASGSLMDRAI